MTSTRIPRRTRGPAELFALNILEGYNLKELGHNSAAFIHTTAEALKLAFGDREKYLGDMHFIKIPTRACSPRNTPRSGGS